MSGFRIRIAIPVIVAGLIVMASSESVCATNGSWGSRGFASGGSWGSGGSFGSSGGSSGFYGSRGYRFTPVRNLLGAIRAGFQARLSSRGSWGSSGGYASNGGSFGSSGGYVSYGSRGGSWGSWREPIGTPVATSYVVPATSDCPSCISGGVIAPASPIVAPAAPYPYYEASPNPTPTPSPAVPEGDLSPPTDNSFGAPPSPKPEPDDGETRIQPIRSRNAVLTVAVPREAKIWINGKPTKTEGTLRSYVSRKLKSGQAYQFDVKAVVIKKGRPVALTRRVSLRAGVQKTVDFDFNKPQLTQLVLKVPQDATVVLSGNRTSATGPVRHYKSRTLMPGQMWEDYRVEVTVKRDGRTIRAEKTLDIEAGGYYELSFELDPVRDLYVLK